MTVIQSKFKLCTNCDRIFCYFFGVQMVVTKDHSIWVRQKYKFIYKNRTFQKIWLSFLSLFNPGLRFWQIPLILDLVFDQNLTRIWSEFDQYLIRIWPEFDQHLTSIWQLLNRLSSVFDHHLTSIWQSLNRLW